MAKIGFICVTPYEVPDFLGYRHQNYRQISSHSFEGNDIGLIVAGQGVDNSKKAANRLISEFSPDTILLIGKASGTQPHMQIGDLLVPEGIRQSGNSIDLKSEALERLLGFLEGRKFRYHKGLTQTVEEVKYDMEGIFPEVIGVEMESFPIAKRAADAGIPYLEVRSVCYVLPEKAKDRDFDKLKKEVLSNARIFIPRLKDFADAYFKDLARRFQNR